MKLIPTIVFVAAYALFGVTGTVLLKRGMTEIGPFVAASSHLPSLLPQAIMNISLLTGTLFYLAAFVFWLLMLLRLPLSVAYPLVSINFALVTLSARLILNESVSLVRWLGVVTILLGIYLVSRG